MNVDGVRIVPTVLSVVAFAAVDSINVLLIAVLVTLRLLSGRAAYRRSALSLFAGHWIAILLLASVIIAFFGRAAGLVAGILESPLFGWFFVVLGVVGLALIFRGSDMYGAARRVVAFTVGSRWNAFRAGFVLGLGQSVTSAPFFGGLMVLNGIHLDLVTLAAALGMYATVALSVPALFGGLLAFGRHGGAAEADGAPGTRVSIDGAAAVGGTARAIVNACTWGAPIMLIVLGVAHLLR